MAAKTKRKPYVKSRSVTKDDVDIGVRIRLRRLELGISQSKLGKALGVTFQQIQKYEQGTSRISGARFSEICRVLQVDPNYLFGWQRQPFKSDEVQSSDSVNLRMAREISLLPPKIRVRVHALIRNLSELSPPALRWSRRNK